MIRSSSLAPAVAARPASRPEATRPADARRPAAVYRKRMRSLPAASDFIITTLLRGVVPAGMATRGGRGGGPHTGGPLRAGRARAWDAGLGSRIPGARYPATREKTRASEEGARGGQGRPPGAGRRPQLLARRGVRRTEPGRP